MVVRNKNSLKEVAKAEPIVTEAVLVPQPEELTVKAKDIRKLLPNVGNGQRARVGGKKDWDNHELKKDIRLRGFINGAGPTPSFRDGDDDALDGNGRLSCLADLADENATLFAEMKVKLLKYPKETTEAQCLEIITRAARTTATFTVWDYHRQNMLWWKEHPNASQVDNAVAMGVRRIRNFFPLAFNEECLVETPQGIEIKPGITGEKLFRNKQGPVQVGKALSIAHKKAVEMFFAMRVDPEHGIDYRLLLDANAAWSRKPDPKKGDLGGDIYVHPEWASPEASWDFLVAQVDPETGEPLSQLVKVLGPRLTQGSDRQEGRGPGKGKMSKKDIEALLPQVMECYLAVALLKKVNGDSAFIGDEADRLLKKMIEVSARILNQDGEFNKLKKEMQEREARTNAALAQALKDQTS